MGLGILEVFSNLSDSTIPGLLLVRKGRDMEQGGTCYGVANGTGRAGQAPTSVHGEVQSLFLVGWHAQGQHNTTGSPAAELPSCYRELGITRPQVHIP